MNAPARAANACSRAALANGIAPPAAGPDATRSASMSRTATVESGHGLGAASDEERDEDPVHAALRQRWDSMQASIHALFGPPRRPRRPSPSPRHAAAPAAADHAHTAAAAAAAPRKAAREIVDDYGDDEDEDDDHDHDGDHDGDGDGDAAKEGVLRGTGKAALLSGLSPHLAWSPAPAVKPAPPTSGPSPALDQGKSSEDVRKELEDSKRAAALAATHSFRSMFYTLEYDRDAMLEQQKLDELDREVEAETAGGPGGAPGTSAAADANPAAATTQGSLGSADLGSSSLTLKHLIARIDAKRDMVKASDTLLRTLISEVRKGRSKWASEDKVGQEELYEAAEKVLMELKAMTEYAQPFLQRVSKREAPDYYNVIKEPMDIGTMIKKLKQFGYRSKKHFCEDLNLIWANCLKYNQDPAHPLRKKALHMRKAADKLTPLIPDVVVRDRADVEAEERRLHAAEGDDSDDDDAPIMASRGRKAPKKGAPLTSARKGTGPPSVAVKESRATPVPDTKPPITITHQPSNLRNGLLRADSEIPDASSAGFSTPPPGSATPLTNGLHVSGLAGSHADLMEVDGPSLTSHATEDVDQDDTDLKTWKYVTKKDRAAAAAERDRLFLKAGKLNLDEPALLRTKHKMRRFVRQQKELTETAAADAHVPGDSEGDDATGGVESLAEGIEKEGDSTLPDYYDPTCVIPDLNDRWKWITDSEGHVVPQTDEFMRLFPKETYKIASGSLNRKIEGNIRQMQETRKICAKIGIVKQMQIQAQTYQNQFQKYEPEPFIEVDPGAVVVSEEGPLMAPWVNRSALQRSIGKIFYHAGFEDFQPSALDSMTDLATEFMQRVGEGFKRFHEQPQPEPGAPVFTFEERILHTLDENGMDVEALESYIRDDVERQGSKLTIMHERMKSHLADLLRPALGDHAGADGVGAFHDGSEQFVGGDFAEDLDEDFFGFRELGLAEEFGLETLSVPLHLLQNRMHAQYQAQNAGPVPSTGLVFEQPPLYEPVTADNLGQQIGLVQDFFSSKLRSNRNEPLVEDEELPQKQRFPKPRLPPTGKITSPRKRPLREQAQAAKKKRKLEESAEREKHRPIPPLKLHMSPVERVGNGMDPEKHREPNNGMISPESVAGKDVM